MQPISTLPSAKDAQAQLQSFQQPDSASVLSQAQQKYGIQGLQDRVNTYKTLTGNLTGAIAAVDPSVTGRTSGSLVTEGQRSALVSRERAPIIGQLGTAQSGLEGATNDFNTADKNARGEADLTIADNASKYSKLKDTYELAAKSEAAAQAQANEDRNFAEGQRQFNVSTSASAAKAAAAVDTSKGYSVKQLSSGNKAYTGPNGQTNLYQYASALAGGDPNQTYQVIKQQLASGSASDKGAYNGIVKLEKQGLSMEQIIARLKASNGYIFN